VAFAQIGTVAVGFIAVELPVWQTFAIGFIVAVGGCFTITVCEADVTEPQELLVVKVIE
jgi:hypothetical protein